MKKLLFVLLIAVAAINVKAQSVSLISRYGKIVDTVTNTGVKLMTSPRITGAQQNVTVSFKAAVLTGTIAGVARLYGSLDNITFTRITAAELRGNSVAPVDSLVINVNATRKHWVINNSPYQYYQVGVTGIGTTTFTINDLLVAH